MMVKSYLLVCTLVLSGTIFSQNSQKHYLEKVGVDVFKEKELIHQNVVSNYDIILIGETHGFSKNYEVGLKMIKEFKQKTNFEYLLAETDFASSQRLNEILQSKDLEKLKDFMNNFNRSPAWCKERYDFYLNLIELNETTDKPIQYFGVDIPSGGIGFCLERMQAIQQKYDFHSDVMDSFVVESEVSYRLRDFLLELHSTIEDTSFSEEDEFEHNFHLNNILNYIRALETDTELQWDRVRDSCMFENYKALVTHYKLSNEKMIGIWGTIHTYQRSSEGVSWFASLVKNNLGKKIYSYRIFYFNSKCMVHASWMPGILKIHRSKKKAFYNIRLQNDDSFGTGKKEGVKLLKKACPKNTTMLFELNQTNSPFKELQNLVICFDENWATTDFFQSAIVVRNSAATSPLGSNKYP